MDVVGQDPATAASMETPYTTGTASQRDRKMAIKQSIKCQALRVLVLDDLSMDSAELLRAVNYDGTSRAFGSVNIVRCVDQLSLGDKGPRFVAVEHKSSFT